MSKDFIPSNNSDLLAWSANLAERLSGDPSNYSISADDAAAFGALQAAWAAAMAVALNPLTRTSPTIAARNDAYSSMVAMARRLNRLIQASPGMTDAKRLELGLSVRGEWTRIARPSVAPLVEIVSTHGHRFRIRLRCATSGKRLKPAGVSMAAVMWYETGPEMHDLPPADLKRWRFERSTSVTLFDIDLPPSVKPGSQIWIVARWQNPRAQPGPASVPVSRHLAGAVGVSMKRAA